MTHANSPDMPTSRKRRQHRRGFSLIEVLIAIAIVLAIGGLVAVNLLGKKDQADIDLTKSQINSFETALKFFKMDMKRYPSEEEGLQVLWNKEAIAEEGDMDRWKGPYLDTPSSEDMWGSAWAYTYPSEQMPERYEIVSAGPDREESSDDDISSLAQFMDEGGELKEEFDEFNSELTEP